MQELTELTVRLDAALTAGDPDAIRAAAGAITGRARAVEESLVHAGRLVDLGLQAASMVHELRQPLSGVKAFAQLIERCPDGPAAVAEKAAAIVRHAEVMESICARLRAYARSESPRRQPADVNAAVDAALGMLRFDLRKSPVMVETELAPHLPRAVADAVELQQILVNLIRNAREAVGEQPGHIRIATGAAAEAVTVTVEDSGPGVPPELQARLFQPFATAGKAGGLGLGLYLSRRLAEEVGGTLALAPTERGAMFRLSIPALVAPADATPR
jgi:C4-dicarboxylate-specific signal transduction histidine kinase